MKREHYGGNDLIRPGDCACVHRDDVTYVGNDLRVSGVNCTVIGDGCWLSGIGSTAYGNYNRGSGTDCTLHGDHCVASGMGCRIYGRFGVTSGVDCRVVSEIPGTWAHPRLQRQIASTQTAVRGDPVDVLDATTVFTDSAHVTDNNEEPLIENPDRVILGVIRDLQNNDITVVASNGGDFVVRDMDNACTLSLGPNSTVYRRRSGVAVIGESPGSSTVWFSGDASVGTPANPPSRVTTSAVGTRGSQFISNGPAVSLGQSTVRRSFYVRSKPEVVVAARPSFPIVPTEPTQSATDDSDEACSICTDRIKNAVCVPCGHRMCVECSLELKQRNARKCPFCNGEFGSIIKVFS